MRQSLTPRRRIALALSAAAVFLVSWVATAAADAPDPKLVPDSPTLHVIGVGPGPVAGTTKITVAGGWDWSTHNADCNLNRAGVGFAVDWGEVGDANEGQTADPNADIGNHVTRIPGPDGKAAKYPGPPDADDQDVDVGSTGSNGLNAVDNVVHPTPTMSTATILPTGHETDVANPAQFALWRGGCGTDTFVDHFANDGLDPEGISGQRAHVLDGLEADARLVEHGQMLRQ